MDYDEYLEFEEFERFKEDVYKSQVNRTDGIDNGTNVMTNPNAKYITTRKTEGILSCIVTSRSL